MPKTARKKLPSATGSDPLATLTEKASALRARFNKLVEETGPLTEQQKLKALGFDQQMHQLEKGFYALVGDLG